MAARRSDDDDGNFGSSLPWYDYRPGVEVPDSVTHLRIGVQQQALAAAAKNGSTPEIIREPPFHLCCFHHPNLLWVQQIHVRTVVETIPAQAFDGCQKHWSKWSL
mmetsp:Transcript_6830/g.19091  ORF Transcript_6830/g.19091 Transcript_6830/m.19091 type:complete len:105 (+) Transcript_6830:44-358(+)